MEIECASSLSGRGSPTLDLSISSLRQNHLGHSVQPAANILPTTKKLADPCPYLVKSLNIGLGSMQYMFNGDNKQVQVKDEFNNTIGQYVYDGNGKRIKKLTASEYVVFVYDGLGKLIGEYSADGPPQAPMVQYTATDPLGSPRVLTNELGEVVSRRDFMPFGEEVAADQTYRTATRNDHSAFGRRSH
jgi:hypothetical protein